MTPLFCVLALVTAGALLTQPIAAQEQGVTKQMVETGKPLFAGRGLCNACHGPDGKGIPNLGADLTDDEWLHSDGSFEGILSSIVQGVSPDKSSTGTVMPPKGGSSLSDEQLKAVAAYVWSLTNDL